MDLELILNSISTVGFPIVSCCVMFKICSANTESLSKFANTLENIDRRIEKIEEDLQNALRN